MLRSEYMYQIVMYENLQFNSLVWVSLSLIPQKCQFTSLIDSNLYKYVLQLNDWGTIWHLNTQQWEYWLPISIMIAVLVTLSIPAIIYIYYKTRLNKQGWHAKKYIIYIFRGIVSSLVPSCPLPFRYHLVV